MPVVGPPYMCRLVLRCNPSSFASAYLPASASVPVPVCVCAPPPSYGTAPGQPNF